MSDQPPTTPPAATPGATTDERPDVEPESLLSLLGDEYTQAILSAMGDDSVPAREIADSADVSRPTVYRRLNRLEAAGAVETVMTVDGDGHHRQAFRVTLDELAVPLLDPEAAEPTYENAGSTDSGAATTGHAPSATHGSD
jgi:DNA-binding transcriptional ArsR family regulator